MKKLYLYNGPVTGVTLSDGTEEILHPGKEKNLPADDNYVKTLVALGRLKEIPPKPQARKSKAKVVEEVNNAD